MNVVIQDNYVCLTIFFIHSKLFHGIEKKYNGFPLGPTQNALEYVDCGMAAMFLDLNALNQ